MACYTLLESSNCPESNASTVSIIYTTSLRAKGTMKSREIPRGHQFVATCMLTANLAQCTDRAAIRPASGRTVRRPAQHQAGRVFVLLFETTPPVTGPPAGHRSAVFYYCAQPTPPPPVVGPWCVTTARYHYFFHTLN